MFSEPLRHQLSWLGPSSLWETITVALGLCNVKAYKLSRDLQDNLPSFIDLIQMLASYTLQDKSSTLKKSCQSLAGEK